MITDGIRTLDEALRVLHNRGDYALPSTLSGLARMGLGIERLDRQGLSHRRTQERIAQALGLGYMKYYQATTLLRAAEEGEGDAHKYAVLAVIEMDRTGHANRAYRVFRAHTRDHPVPVAVGPSQRVVDAEQRQAQVKDLVGRGYTAPEIAQMLDVHRSTVNNDLRVLGIRIGRGTTGTKMATVLDSATVKLGGLAIVLDQVDLDRLDYDGDDRARWLRAFSAIDLSMRRIRSHLKRR